MYFRKILIIVAASAIGIALFFGSGKLYLDAQNFNVTGIQEETFTFYNDEYESGDTYILVFEQDKPLYIPSFVHPNKTYLGSLEKNELLVIGYIDGDSDEYDKKAVYVYHNDVEILTLEDYINDHQSNLYMGSTLTGIFGIICIIFVIVSIFIKDSSLTFKRLLNPYEVEASLETIYIPPVPGISRIHVGLVNNRKQFRNILNTLPDYSIQFSYLEEDQNNETGILFYRIGKRLVVEYLYYDDGHYVLELYNEILDFSYPIVIPLEPYEFVTFKNALEVYSSEMDIPIVIEIIRDEE